MSMIYIWNPFSIPKGYTHSQVLGLQLSFQIKLNLNVCRSFNLSQIVILLNPSGIFCVDEAYQNSQN